LCAALIRQINIKSMQVQLEEVSKPGAPFRARIQHQNVNKLYARIIELKWDFFLSTSNDMYGDKLIEHYLEYDAVKEWTIELPDDGDHHRHSIEVEMPALPHGNYVVLVGSSPEFSYDKEAVGHAHIWSSDLSFISRHRTDQSYDFTVLNRTTSAPVKGATVQLYFQKYDYDKQKYEIKKAEAYTTDADGEIKIKKVTEYRNFMVDIVHGDDRYNNARNFYQSRIYNYSEDKQIVHLFTDRAIYRPGQTIYFKGLVLQKTGDDVKIVANGNNTVYFYDANSQEVAQVDVKTNEYGTFAGTFTAPVGVLNGKMSISATYGSKSFRVEEYKRPKFEVLFDPVEGTYKLEQDVEVKGKAKAYAGSNIDGAEVKYRVTREARFPWWCWYYWGYSPSSTAMEITNGVSKTDENGEFTITFNAIPDRSVASKFSPTYTYTVSADVVDINGETHSATQYVSVGYTAMNISVNLPATINSTEAGTYELKTTNLNGQDVFAEVTVIVTKLNEAEKLFRNRLWSQADQTSMTKEEYYEKFPRDLYANELDSKTLGEGKRVMKKSVDTEKSKELDLADLKKWKQGTYILEASAIDEFGQEVKFVKQFVVFDPNNKSCPIPTYLWTSPLKIKGEPGETASLLIGTSASDVKVKYEVEHQGKILHTEWLSLSNEQRKIDLPIEEKHRGNFAVHFTFVKDGRAHTWNPVITVPYTNKALDIEFTTFRNKLLPGQDEEWTLKIKGKNGEKVMAEMLATMYDASLDAFASNQFALNLYNSYYASLNWRVHEGFSAISAQIHQRYWNTGYGYPSRSWDRMNWFGYNFYGYYYRNAMYSNSERGEVYMSANSAAPMNEIEVSDDSEEEVVSPAALDMNVGTAAATSLEGSKDQQGRESTPGSEADRNQETGKAGGLGNVKARTNFNETAFFFPQLQTNEEGEIIVKFTIPESLTRWKFLGLAHTKDLKVGTITEEIVTQKELMVMPNAPRFFREGDRIVFSAKITNLSDADQTGNAQLMLFDATTMQPIDKDLKNNKAEQTFSAKKGQSTALTWEINIPDNVQAVTYRVVAKAGKHSDGEEMAVPVLTNRMLVTESLPLPIKNMGTKTYRLEKLLKSGMSKTLVNHKLTLEYTANPAWYAIQAMPYMMEYPYECAEQTFTRFYANSIATSIVNSSPKIKKVFEQWKTYSPDALLSNLEKNQELKEVLLQETPWVLQSQDENQRKRRVALLFDLNKMSSELARALQKLEKSQVSNGAWPWFPGMPESRYITQHIACGLGHLDHLGIKNVREDNRTWQMTKKAVDYLDQRIIEDFREVKRRYPDTYLSERHLGYTQIQYLYMRSFFSDLPIKGKLKDAVEYYKAQSVTYWTDYVQNNYVQGLIALALHRMDESATAKNIVKSLKERALIHEELGMYWKGMMDGGFYWYEAPIETQAVMIEVFHEVTNDADAVNELRVWLLKQKQTQDWGTTKATAEACYALLLNGTDWLAVDNGVTVKVGKITIVPGNKSGFSGGTRYVKSEPGTGYFKTVWNGNEVMSGMGEVTVTKTSEGPGWGALYWQYFEQLDKITPHETPLKLDKKLYLERITATGPVLEEITEQTELKPGDKVKVRIELRVDRAMEYVHMKDMRASGFEPINVLSRYKWQDGLGYYEMTKDASTNFFFDYLPRGTFVFEYPLRVQHNGDFSNGIATIQCMYAPEFTSHSEGIRVKVGK
jgi:hypothetical protein